MSVGLVGVILAIVLVIILSIRGLSILIVAPLCSAIVLLTNNSNILEGILKGPKSFMGGTSGFIQSFFIIFALGSILAKYIEASGAVNSIASSIIKITGKEKPYSILIAIFLISTVLTYGGVSLFVVLFAVVPIARKLFKQLNMSWRLLVTPYFLGIATLTMTMLPGTPAIQNVIPTTVLHTTLTAAPIEGIVASIVIIIWGCLCMKRELKESILKNEVFDSKYDKLDDTTNENGPGLIVSLAPLVSLLSIIFIGSFLKFQNVIIPALIISIVLEAILFNKYIDNHKNILNEGAISAISPTVFSAAAVGFGAVVSSSEGFKIILTAIQTFSHDPLFNISLLSGTMAGVTGSSSGALGIVMNNFVQPYLHTGVNPEKLHRLATISSGILTCLPQCGALLSFYSLTGLKHQGTYKNLFISVVIGSFFAFIAAYFTAIIL